MSERDTSEPTDEDQGEWQRSLDAIFNRMWKALVAKKGVRLSYEDLQFLNTTTVGQIMAEYREAGED